MQFQSTTPRFFLTLFYPGRGGGEGGGVLTLFYPKSEGSSFLGKTQSDCYFMISSLCCCYTCEIWCELMVGCKATRNCQCFWQYFLNFWTFCDIKSSCFGHSQKKLWRYVKLQSCSFYWVKAKWRLHFACKGKNNFVRKTNFPEFCWRQQNHGFSFWKFLCCPIKLRRVIIMASIKLILGVVVETRVF